MYWQNCGPRKKYLGHGKSKECKREFTFYKLVTGKLTFILPFLLDFKPLPFCVCNTGA